MKIIFDSEEQKKRFVQGICPRDFFDDGIGPYEDDCRLSEEPSFKDCSECLGKYIELEVKNE